MIDIKDIEGKRFAILLTDYTNSEDGECYVIGGVAKIKDGILYVDRKTEIDFPIPPTTYSRIKIVGDDVREVLLDAEYFTMLSVGPAPESE